MLHALSSLPPDDKAFFYQLIPMPITVDIQIKKPISIVWDCFVNPMHIIHWNQASSDWHCPKAENTLEVGGTFVYTMAAKDGSSSFDLVGMFDEVIPHTCLAYTLGDGRKVRVTFVESDDHVNVIEQFDPEQIHSEEMQKQGWQLILNSLKAYCEAL